MYVYMNGLPTLPSLQNLEVVCRTPAGLPLYEDKQTDSGCQNRIPGTYRQPGGGVDIARELGHFRGRLQVGEHWVSMTRTTHAACHITWLELTFGSKCVEKGSIPHMRTGCPWEPSKTIGFPCVSACPPKGRT